MIAVAGGLGAALAWACATLCAARSSRLIGAPSALSWVMLIGLLLTIPFVCFSSRGPQPADLGWLLLEGFGNIGGLLLVYRAVQFGVVGVVGAIVSADGAIAAALGLLFGEPIAVSVAGALAVIAIGIAATATPPRRIENRDAVRRSAATAVAGVLALGASLYGLARVGQALPVSWALLPPRAVATVFVALPLAARSRLRAPGKALHYVAAGGFGEVAGFIAYTYGARHNVAIASVLSSLLGPISAGMARLLFGERLSASQLAGVGLIVAGLIGLAVLSS